MRASAWWLAAKSRGCWFVGHRHFVDYIVALNAIAMLTTCDRLTNLLSRRDSQYTYALLLRLDRDLHSSTRQASNTSNNKAATNQIPSHLSHHHPSPMTTTADPQRPSPSRPLSPHHLSNIKGPIRRWAVTKSNTWFDGESTARLQTFRARNPTVRDTGTGCPRAQLPEIFVSPPEESTHRLEEVRSKKYVRASSDASSRLLRAGRHDL